jgi:hypothetical protein
MPKTENDLAMRHADRADPFKCRQSADHGNHQGRDQNEITQCARQMEDRLNANLVAQPPAASVTMFTGQAQEQNMRPPISK